MNRNLKIIYFSAIAVLLVGIAVAVYFLYRDVPGYEWMTSGESQESKTAVMCPAEKAKETVSAPVAESALNQDIPAEKEEQAVEKKPEPVEIKIPKGPFSVKNSATGKTCYIGQSSDNSIYMEQDGKTLWTIPFKDKLCGKVEEIDYYENGKLQYLFIAGGKLYLLDRLGKNVKTFPKTLSGEPLLGPEVYDFNGNRKYNVMVLNKDNTIHMFNMKGQHPSSWKGITSEEQILGLPVLKKISGKSYWIVNTVQSTLVYPFYGGKEVKKLSGDVDPSSIVL